MSTSLCAFVCVLTDLAAFTRTAPGGSQRRAALRLERGAVDVDLTAAILDVQPARSLHAVCRRRRGREKRGVGKRERERGRREREGRKRERT